MRSTERAGRAQAIRVVVVGPNVNVSPVTLITVRPNDGPSRGRP